MTLPKYIKSVFLVLNVILGTLTSFAGHEFAASINDLKPLGNNQYYINVSRYIKCGGLAGSASTSIKIGCNNGPAATYNLQVLPFVAPTPYPKGGPYIGVSPSSSATYVVQEMSEACSAILDPSVSGNSRCRSGFQQSTLQLYKFDYAGIITLAGCDSLYLEYEPATAGGTSLTIASTKTYRGFVNTNLGSYYGIAQKHLNFNMVTASCIGQKQFLNLGYTHPTDSIRFVPAVCIPNYAACATSPTSYSGNGGQMIKSVVPSFDTLTGQFFYTPAVAGIHTFGFWLEQYDPCSRVLKSKILIEQSIEARISTNKIPTLMGHSFTGLSKIDSTHFSTCSSNNFTIRDTILDVDKDTLLIFSNFSKVFPGGTVTLTRIDSTTTVAEFSAQAPNRNFLNPFFFYKISDDACDVPGLLYGSYTIKFTNSASISVLNGSNRICRGDTIELYSDLGKTVSWRSLSGASILTSGVGMNALYTDTTSKKELLFWPNTTTTLELTVLTLDSCTGQLCKALDTLKIQVGSNFSVRIGGDSIYCYEDTSALFAVTDSNFNYTYKWTINPSFSFADTSRIGFLVDANYKVDLLVMSDSGCAKEATLPASYRAGVLDFSINASCDTVCPNTSIQVAPEFDLTNCGVGLVPTCPGSLYYGNTTSTQSNSGTAALAWPCPLPTTQQKSRQQIIYSYNDLRQMGMNNSGTINSIAFYVSGLVDTGFTVDVTLKLKCTKDSVLSGGFLNGFTQVAFIRNQPVRLGWNEIKFDQNYRVLDSSGFIMELCTQTSGFGTNPSFKVVSLNRSVAVVGYGSFASCTAPVQSLATSTFQPVLRIDACPNPVINDYKYNWQPSNLFADSSLKNNSALVNSSTKISLIITDSVTNCALKIEKDIYVSQVPVLSIENDTISCQNQSLGMVTRIVNPVSGGKYLWQPGKLFSDSTAGRPTFLSNKDEQITLSYSNSCGCSVSATHLLSSKPLPGLGVLTPPSICELDAPVILKSKAGTGKFLGRAINGSTNTLDPQSSQITTRYNYVDSITVYFSDTNQFCKADTSFEIGITPQFDTVLQVSRSYCESQHKVNFKTRHSGGTWSGPGMSANGDFTSSVATVGLHIIRVDSTGLCGNTGIYNIRVKKTPDVLFDVKDYCVQDPCNFIDTLMGTPVGGQWNSTIWAGGMSASGAIDVCSLGYGAFAVSYGFTDVTNGCSDTITKSFNVDSNSINLILNPSYSYCGGGSVTIDAGNNSTTSYLWNNNETTQQIKVSGGSSGTYKVVATSTLKGNCRSEKSTEVIYDQTCLGLTELSGKLNFTIYPNPANNELFILCEMDLESNKFIQILDASGRLVDSFEIKQSKTNYDTSFLESGVYFMEVSSAEESGFSKFVVKH